MFPPRRRSILRLLHLRFRFAAFQRARRRADARQRHPASRGVAALVGMKVDRAHLRRRSVEPALVEQATEQGPHDVDRSARGELLRGVELHPREGLIGLGGVAFDLVEELKPGLVCGPRRVNGCAGRLAPDVGQAQDAVIPLFDQGTVARVRLGPSNEP